MHTDTRVKKIGCSGECLLETRENERIQSMCLFPFWQQQNFLTTAITWFHIFDGMRLTVASIVPCGSSVGRNTSSSNCRINQNKKGYYAIMARSCFDIREKSFKIYDDIKCRTSMKSSIVFSVEQSRWCMGGKLTLTITGLSLLGRFTGRKWRLGILNLIDNTSGTLNGN